LQESEQDNEDENDHEVEQVPGQAQPRPHDDSGSEPQDHEIPNENGANSFAQPNRA
jgi:hypothetical protein